jgi:hypothetical protein
MHCCSRPWVVGAVPPPGCERRCPANVPGPRHRNSQSEPGGGVWRAPPPSQLPGPTRGHHCAAVRELSCLAATGRRMHPLRSPQAHCLRSLYRTARCHAPYCPVFSCTLARYRALAAAAIEDIVARGRLPIVVGMSPPPPPPSPPTPTRPRHKQHRVLHAHRQHCLTFCVPHTSTGCLIRVLCVLRGSQGAPCTTFSPCCESRCWTTMRMRR